jgi:hypothetical protein
VAGGAQRHGIPELVRINHLKNCVLCHALTTKGSRLRSLEPLAVGVPHPNQGLTRGLNSGYAASDNLFVRIDVTYLRPDFSVMQPVANPDLWPALQRFDFVVRRRPVPDKLVGILTRTARRHGPSPQREVLLHTLQRLTGQNPGRDFADWQPLLPSVVKGAG